MYLFKLEPTLALAQVYIGQHNIVAYAPGPNSYLDARYFDGFEQLGDALKATYRTPSAYMVSTGFIWHTRGCQMDLVVMW